MGNGSWHPWCKRGDNSFLRQELKEKAEALKSQPHLQQDATKVQWGQGEQQNMSLLQSNHHWPVCYI